MAAVWIGAMRGKKTSVEHIKAVTEYEELRNLLLRNGCDRQLEKPLAHWVMPTDRRLPLVLLGRPLRELLGSRFDELAATPGVGRKKIRSFLDLLSRIAETEADSDLDDPANRTAGDSEDKSHLGAGNGFDPDHVSELVWGQWQETVRRNGLGRELLGRVAPTLKNVTRVIWATPLSEYLDTRLADLRRRKTYGEKRVRAVLEVFFGIHRMLGSIATQAHLNVRVVPRLIDRVECWAGSRLQSATLPDADALRENYIVPLIEQLEVDASQQVVELAKIRLGLNGPITSVRQAARQMELTRARVYQLLNETNDILTVRWPLGRCQTYQLLDRLESTGSAIEQFRAAVELFYPSARRGASGPVENTPTSSDQ